MEYSNVYSDQEITFARKLDSNPKDELFRLHVHTDYELFCFVSGNVDYVIEGTAHRMTPGCVFCVRPGEFHKVHIISSEPYERYVINFSRSLIDRIDASGELLIPFDDRPLGVGNVYPPELFDNVSILNLFKEIDETSNGNGDRLKMKIVCRLFYILERILEKSSENIGEGMTATTVEKIIEYINYHLGTESLTSENLSKKFFLSEPQLNRAFKKATGSPLGKYINIKRLFYAKELLSKGVSASETCFKCGFNDYPTFFRAYKKQFGISPKEDMIK
ncbi:MAG: AraC family transcriptional regulator [Firmicutes bacterium]|nr:AraC family transcriptional regulator [Candidatus Colimorpha enterica]